MNTVSESKFTTLRESPLTRDSKLDTSDKGTRPFEVFLCYKKSSGKDYADHLKTGLEELGLHTFEDCKDILRLLTLKRVGRVLEIKRWKKANILSLL